MKRYMVSILVVLLLLTGCGGGKVPEETTTPTPAPVSPGQDEMSIEEMAVGLVSDMAAGEFDKVVSYYPFSPEMKAVISDGKFIKDQIWNPLISVYGEFSEITGTLASQYHEYDIISVKTSFEKAKLIYHVVFNADKLVAGLNFAPTRTVPHRLKPLKALQKQK